MYALYLTHPQVIVDPGTPVPRWRLSDDGRARAQRFARAALARGIKRMVSSHETKALETASILAAANGAAVEALDGFEENDRSSTGYVPHKRFLQLRETFFGRPDQSVEGWESAGHAQRRIVLAAMAVLQGHDAREPIAFVGHGAVGTLLKCHFGKRSIAMVEDQPDGGGNTFMVRLADLHLISDWMPMESFSAYGVNASR